MRVHEDHHDGDATPKEAEEHADQGEHVELAALGHVAAERLPTSFSHFICLIIINAFAM